MADIITQRLQDPAQSFQQAYQFGAGIRQMQAQAEQAAFEREQARLKQEDAERAAAAEAEKQADIAAFGEKISNGTVTTQDYLGASLFLGKDQNDAFQAAYKMLTDEQRQSSLRETGELFAALNSGHIDLAISMFDEQIRALENSGQKQQDVAELKALREAAKVTPESVAGYLGASLGALGEDGVRVLDNALKLTRGPGGKTKAYADIAGTEATTDKTRQDIEESRARTAKIVAELEAAKKPLAPEKVFAQEENLRKEYTARTALYREARRNLFTIEASAKDGSGAGDVALVTSFMKMLDPGGVVRDTDFANARDTAGTLGMLKNLAGKVATGTILDPGQRQSFVRLAGQYMAAADKEEQRIKKSLERVVKNYGLNPDNVFEAEAQRTVEVDY